MINETDILLAVLDDEKVFSHPVREAMASNLKTVPLDTDPRALLPILNEGYVPLVVDQGKYHGLVTSIDLLNYLRRRMRD